MKKIAYIRVSSIDQNEESQIALLKEKFNPDRYFSEKISGAHSYNRPQLREMLEFVREGDHVVVLSWSRLSRSLKDLLDILEQLNKKKVKLTSVQDNFDLDTPTGQLMLGILGSLYQYERELIHERQKVGIENAKKLGKYKGKKPISKPHNFDFYAQKYLSSNKFDRYPFQQFLNDTKLTSTIARRFLNQYKQNLQKQKQN